MASEILRLSSGSPRETSCLGALAPVVGLTVGVEAELADRGDVDHVVHPPVAGPGEPVPVVSPEDASRGAVPVQDANRFRSGEPGDVADVGQDPRNDHLADTADVHQARAAGDPKRLELGGGLLHLRPDALAVVAYTHLRTHSPEAGTEGLRAVRELAAIVVVCTKAVEGVVDVLAGAQGMQAASSPAWGYRGAYGRDYEEDEP